MATVALVMSSSLKCRLVLSFLLTIGALELSPTLSVSQPLREVVYSAVNISHEFSGFGADLVWPTNDFGFSGLEALKIKFVRVASSFGNMSRLHAITEPLGIRWVLVMWSAPTKYADASNMLVDVDGFASFWVETVQNMSHAGYCPQYIDLMNEPDSMGSWSLGIAPLTYNALVKSVRAKLDAASFGNVTIVGPGLAFLDHDGGNGKWIGALDREGLQALGVFASHAWDDGAFCHGGASCQLHQWRNFGDATISAAPSKPRWITEYATKEFDIHGILYPDPDLTGGYSSAFTMAYAARVIQNTLALLNVGAASAFYWQVQDNYKSWGWITADGKPKPIYSAILNLFPKVPVGSGILVNPEQPQNSCIGTRVQCPEGIYTSLFTDPNSSRSSRSLVFAAANDADKLETVQIRIVENGPFADVSLREGTACVLKSHGSNSTRIMDEAKLENSTVDLRSDPLAGVIEFNVSLEGDSTLTLVIDIWNLEDHTLGDDGLLFL